MLSKKRPPLSVELAGLRNQLGSLLEVLSGDQRLLRLDELLDLEAELLQNSSRFRRQVLQLGLRKVLLFPLRAGESLVHLLTQALWGQPKAHQDLRRRAFRRAQQAQQQVLRPYLAGDHSISRSGEGQREAARLLTGRLEDRFGQPVPARLSRGPRFDSRLKHGLDLLANPGQIKAEVFQDRGGNAPLLD